jgi:hypothetical protein
MCAVSAPDIEPVALDELVDGGDPLDCPACIEAGDVCSFHAGWAAGWDACAAFVARVVEDERIGELSHSADIEEVAR